MVAIPLLVETRGADRFDRVLVVDCEPELQLARLQARDGMTREQAQRMLAAQVTREQRLAVADDVILNNGEHRCLARPGGKAASAVLDGGPGAIGQGHHMSADQHDTGSDRFTAAAAVAQNSPMAEEAQQQHAPVALAAPLVFEQPLNERMRTFLRLDFLYNQALYHNEMQSQWGSRAAMGSLLDILAIAARGDVRADVQKELERHLAQLNVFQSKPGVDSARLRTVMSNLLRLRADLVACGSNYLAGLKDSEFLSAIKHRSAIPGGTCEFDLPDFFFWLNQATDQRARSFNEWLATLRPLCDAIAELLWITRQHGKPRQEIARGGVYHITFERDTPIQLVRIALPVSSGLYPETSGSHYRCSGEIAGVERLEPASTANYRRRAVHPHLLYLIPGSGHSCGAHTFRQFPTVRHGANGLTSPLGILREGRMKQSYIFWVAPLTALMATPDATHAAERGWYLGVAYSNVSADYAPPPESFGPTTIETPSHYTGGELDTIGSQGFKLVGGFRAFEWLAFEADYLDLSGDSAPLGLVCVTQPCPDQIRAQTTNASLSALALWPVGKFDVFAPRGSLALGVDARNHQSRWVAILAPGP